MSLPKRDGVQGRYYLIQKPDTNPEVLEHADQCIQDVLDGTAKENHSGYPMVVRNQSGTPFLPSQLLERYLSKLPLKGFPYEEAVTFCDVNTTRISNFFVEIRVVSYLKSLAIQGFPFFCVWLMCIGKHQNCEDVFIRRHRYMNTAFRYSYLDMLLQMLAVSCISAFDGGEPRCKSEYTHPHSSENAVQKCIRAGRPPLF